MSDSQSASQPEEPRLDKPAQVGNGRFGVGVSWSTVIAAAQRHHEYMNTPEKETERIAAGNAFWRAFASHDAATAPSADDSTARDIAMLAGYAEGSKSPAIVNAARRIVDWLNSRSASPAPATDDDRANFESAWTKHYGCAPHSLIRHHTLKEQYANHDTQRGWEGWQLSRAAAPQAGLLLAARALVDMRHCEMTRDHEIVAGIDALECALIAEQPAAPTVTATKHTHPGCEVCACPSGHCQAERAAAPQAGLTDEQIRSLKYVIARLEIASVTECEHANNLRALLAEQSAAPKAVDTAKRAIYVSADNLRLYECGMYSMFDVGVETPNRTIQLVPASLPRASEQPSIDPLLIDDSYRNRRASEQADEAVTGAERDDFEARVETAAERHALDRTGAGGWIFEKDELPRFAKAVLAGQSASAIHYPQCWDTAAYPTLESALSEVYAAFKCTSDECAAPDPATPYPAAADVRHAVHCALVELRDAVERYRCQALWEPEANAEAAIKTLERMQAAPPVRLAHSSGDKSA